MQGYPSGFEPIMMADQPGGANALTGTGKAWAADAAGAAYQSWQDWRQRWGRATNALTEGRRGWSAAGAVPAGLSGLEGWQISPPMGGYAKPSAAQPAPSDLARGGDMGGFDERTGAALGAGGPPQVQDVQLARGGDMGGFNERGSPPPPSPGDADPRDPYGKVAYAGPVGDWSRDLRY
jgi:hypothetical protein